jgi:hypothetical protein
MWFGAVFVAPRDERDDHPGTRGNTRNMKRPIGVILLAVGAGLLTLYQLYLMLVYLGILKFNFIGQDVAFDDAQWGAALWSLLIAAIWAWVAIGFWNLRAYAVQFGIFISLFTLIWGFFALLFGNTYEAQTIPWLLAGAIYLYLSYPGVQQHFVAQERARLTPEQLAALDALDKANAEANAKNAPGM